MLKAAQILVLTIIWVQSFVYVYVINLFVRINFKDTRFDNTWVDYIKNASL